MIAGVIASLAKLVAGCTSEWLVEPDTKQRVYVANHTSHLDFVVLWASLSPRVRALTIPVAARDYWSKGWRRYAAENVFHAVLIDRVASDDGERRHLGRQAVESMIAAMGESNSLILFPEGTRGTGERIGEFKSGLYYLCRARPGLEVMPVYLSNLSRILPKGEMLPVPLLSSVRFGRPLHLESREEKMHFLNRVRDAVAGLAER
jgi:1-acyl-sn-glycerol-3-phosphate acyltransferase